MLSSSKSKSNKTLVVKNKLSSDIKLIKHNHKQRLRQLKQEFDVKKTRKTKDLKNKISAVEKETDKGVVDIEELKSKLQKEHESTLKEIEQEYSQKQKEMVIAYEEKITGMERSGKKNDSEAKLNLSSMKQKHEKDLERLTTDLSNSEEKLKRDVVVIDKLKMETKRLNNELEGLSGKLDREDKTRQEFSRQRDLITKNSKNMESDSHEIRGRFANLRKTEEEHASAVFLLEKKIEDTKASLKRCKLGVKNMRESMEIEKEVLLQIYSEREDFKNKVLSLQETLETFKKKYSTAEDLLEHVRSNYRDLTQRSAKEVSDLKKIMGQRDNYTDNLDREKTRIEKTNRSLALNRDEMIRHIKRTENNASQSYNLLGKCETRSKAILNIGSNQTAYIQKLEKRITQLVESFSREGGEVIETSTSRAIQDDELETLRGKLSYISNMNSQLATLLDSMDSRLSDKEDSPASFTNFVKELHSKERVCRSSQAKLEKELEKKDRQLQTAEYKLEALSKGVVTLESELRASTKKSDLCVYTEEKLRLEKDISDMSSQKITLRKQMAQVVSQNNMLIADMRLIGKDYENQKTLLSRYETDIKELKRSSTTSKRLSSEFEVSRRLLATKDMQLGSLTDHMNSLTHRVKELENVERELTSRLDSAPPEKEVAEIKTRLNECKSFGRENVVKLERLQEVADKLHEQLGMSKTQNTLMAEVVYKMETAKAELQQEHANRTLLENALSRCEDNNRVSTEELKARLKSTEEQYKKTMFEHESVVMDSKVRLAHLKEELDRAVLSSSRVPYNGTNLNDVNYPIASKKKAARSYEEPVRRQAQIDPDIKDMQQRMKKLQSSLQEDLSELERRRKTGPSTDNALYSLKLRSAPDMLDMDKRLKNGMAYQEREVMRAREDTYKEMLKAAQSPPGQNMPQMLKDIQKRGNVREQQKLSDMLELRALAASLSTQNKLVKKTQWDMLNLANRQETQTLSGLVRRNASPSELRNASYQQNLVLQAQQQYMMGERNSAAEDLKDQQKYLRNLEFNLLPKMRQTEEAVGLMSFPDVTTLRNQIAKERNITFGVVENEKNTQTDQTRIVSAIDRRISVLVERNAEVTRQINNLIEQPGPKAQAEVLDVLEKNDMESLERRRFEEAGKNMSSRFGTTWVVRPPRQGQEGRKIAGPDTMRVDEERAKIEISGKTLFTDSAIVFPKEAFPEHIATNIDNFLEKKKNVIVASYSYAPEEKYIDLVNVKYIVLLQGIQQVLPHFKKYAGDSSIKVQLVWLRSNGKCVNLFSKDDVMTSNCRYSEDLTGKTLNADITGKELSRTVEQIIKDAMESSNDDHSADDHVVLTFSVDGNRDKKALVHIAEVVLNTVEEDSLRLFDNSWVSYLKSSIDNQEKVQIIFNTLPFEDEDTQRKNKKIANVSAAITNFLSDLANKRRT
jgi:hypothetical protein